MNLNKRFHSKETLCPSLRIRCKVSNLNNHVHAILTKLLTFSYNLVIFGYNDYTGANSLLGLHK